MKIGFTELLVILVVALIVLGPDKLPYYMRKLGQGLREFRKYSGELTEDIKENIITPLDEAQAPLREAMEPLAEMEAELKSTKKDIEKSFADIGKVKKAPADDSDAAAETAVAADPAERAETEAQGVITPEQTESAGTTHESSDTVDQTPERKEGGQEPTAEENI